jgi:hypothetical protein
MTWNAPKVYGSFPGRKTGGKEMEERDEREQNMREKIEIKER